MTITIQHQYSNQPLGIYPSILQLLDYDKTAKVVSSEVVGNELHVIFNNYRKCVELFPSHSAALFVQSAINSIPQRFYNRHVNNPVLGGYIPAIRGIK